MLMSRLGQAAPAVPAQCEADQVPWNGKCFEHDQWDTDDKTCPEGVIVIPDGEKKPRCVLCDGYDGMQQPMNFCASVLSSGADTKLNEVFQRILKRFPDRASALRAAQSGWSKNREKACLREEKEFEGGSIAPQIYSDCVLQRTRKRTEELKRMMEPAGNARAEAAKGCVGGPPSPTPIDRHATVVAEKSHFQSEPKPCPPASECSWLRKGYLVHGDQVAETAISGDFACVAFKTTIGWLPLRDLCEAGAPCAQSLGDRR